MRGDTVDQPLDDPSAARIGARAALERADAKQEAILVHLDLELEALLDGGAGDGCRRERQFVHAVDRKIQARAETPENERDDARSARTAGYGEENPVRRVSVSRARDRWRGDHRSRYTFPVPSQPNLVLTAESNGDATVIRVVGELDLSTVAAFDTELQVTSDRTVVVLTDCTFIDSSALRSLVRAERVAREAGGAFSLASPSQPVQRVLEVAALDRVIPVFATLDEALTYAPEDSPPSSAAARST
jgi:anti-anti-sigma factor